MPETMFMAIHQFKQEHLDKLGIDGFDDKLIQDTINTYAEECKKIGCIAITVYSDYEGHRNVCVTKADSAQQVVEAHPEGVPRDTLIDVFEVNQFFPAESTSS